MRPVFLLVAALAAVGPASAIARTQAQLDCAARRAPPGLADNLAAAMVAADRKRLGPLQEQLARVIRQCLPITRLTDREAEIYYDYSLSRLPREALGRQLARAGIVASRIDAAMGFDPARPNTTIRDMGLSGEAQTSAIIAASGIAENRLTPANRRKVATYIDLTPRMYRYLHELN